MQFNFDRIADRYDSTRRLPEGIAEKISDWILARLPPDPRIIEVGVGTGRIALPFVLKNIRYTGLDVSKQMIAKMQAKLQNKTNRMNLILADATMPIPIKARSQDAIIAVHVFHLVDCVKMLGNIRDLLKWNGSLIWGYERSDESGPWNLISDHFYWSAERFGAPKKRDFFAPEAREILKCWGIKPTHHTVASWKQTGTYRGIINRYASRITSSTWSVSEKTMQDALQETERWATEQYGDLDTECEDKVEFIVDWYDFGQSRK